MDSMVFSLRFAGLRFAGLRFLGLAALAAVFAACAGPGATQCEATGILCPVGMHCAAAEPVCLSDLNLCGNAHVDSDEVCDDGNTKDGDGCSADCKSDETCGNGRVDMTVGEVCDTPLARNEQGKLICSANCKSNESCGNGILDTEAGEVCDDGGNIDGDGVPGKRCSHDCTSDETCGNNKVDRAVGEKCDDGNTVDGDTCSHCQFGPGCGNGVIDYDKDGNPTEECDDGNQINEDDCRADCVVNRCGDSVLNSAPGPHHEDCDDGDLIDTNGCTNACKPARCGDGIVKAGVEECDDGNAAAGDGCSDSCKKEFCGDGVANNDTGHGKEPCDSSGLATSGCNFNCTTPSCGDGIVNPMYTPTGGTVPEQCDPPSVAGGCSALCQFEHCGNGVTDPGEECDNGSNAAGSGCVACHVERCGNGILDQGEECDDGNASDDDACLSSGTSAQTRCKIARCGDGKTQTGHEDCDDGASNGVSPSTCSTTCHTVSCGNGVKEQGEECDDNNGSDEDDCLSSGSSAATRCKIAQCGDGKTDKLKFNGVQREDCDNGAANGTSGDRCSATCHTAECGNGVIDQDETCDDGLGNNGPGKRCNASCHINVCGDGDASPTEQCDVGTVNVSGAPTPRDGQIPNSTLFCDADCTLSVCGDGHWNKATNSGEDCDDGAANGTSSQTCSSFCRLVACGNGLRDFGEQCDPGTGTTQPVADSSTCDGDCTAVACGDGRQNTPAGEACDDGPDNGNPCGYNDRSCTRCNATCTGTTHPGGPYCGDGLASNSETCDQGALNGARCTYGDMTCLTGASRICNTSCDGFMALPNGPYCGDGLLQKQYNEQCDPGGGLTAIDGTTCDSDCTFAFCGDGHTNAAALEICDDGNASSCGSCSADCTSQTLSAATGSITTVAVLGGANIADGDTVTLNDGFHPAVVFEFDLGGAVTSGHVAVAVGATDSAITVATKLRTAINNQSTLDITAAPGSTSQVLLTNGHLSSLGNKPIGRTGTLAAGFTFADMLGGAGGDCVNGTGCKSDDDCASGHCDLTTGRCATAP